MPRPRGIEKASATRGSSESQILRSSPECSPAAYRFYGAGCSELAPRAADESIALVLNYSRSVQHIPTECSIKSSLNSAPLARIRNGTVFFYDSPWLAARGDDLLATRSVGSVENSASEFGVNWHPSEQSTEMRIPRTLPSSLNSQKPRKWDNV